MSRLPAPQPRAVGIRPLFEHVITLLGAEDVQLESQADCECLADPSQLEQVLVNLVQNAQEATAGTTGDIVARWRESTAGVEIEIEDWGCGIANPSNIFVPFFTNRQIAWKCATCLHTCP